MSSLCLYYTKPGIRNIHREKCRPDALLSLWKGPIRRPLNGEKAELQRLTDVCHCVAVKRRSEDLRRPGTLSSKVGGVKAFCCYLSKNNAKLALTPAPPFSKVIKRKYISGTFSVTRLLFFSPQPGQQGAALRPSCCCYWQWPTATCSRRALTLSCVWRCSGSPPPSWDFLPCTSRGART